MPSITLKLLQSIVPRLHEWKIFIETGTFYGDTIFEMEPGFDELHTIELDPILFERVRQSYTGQKIRFHLGSSPLLLKEILPSISTPAIFFLDAHWSCGETAKGAKDVPLIEELESICHFFSPRALIIIDDLRLFGQGPNDQEPVDWSQINIGTVISSLGGRKAECRENSQVDKLVVRLGPL